MFVTTASMRIPSPCPPGVYVWKTVEIELLTPLVLVSATRKETSTELPLTHTFVLLPDHLPQLVATSEFTIDQVDLLSPSRINGTPRWKLEPLLELWESVDSATGATTAWLYCVADRTYCEPPETPADERPRDRCLFDAQTLRAAHQ